MDEISGRIARNELPIMRSFYTLSETRNGNLLISRNKQQTHRIV